MTDLSKVLGDYLVKVKDPAFLAGYEFARWYSTRQRCCTPRVVSDATLHAFWAGVLWEREQQKKGGDAE